MRRMKSDLAVFRVRNGVDQRIVDAGCLCQQDGQGRNQRRDLGDVSPSANHADDGERSPCHQPAGDVHDGHLSDADLGRDLLLVGVAAQRGHVHLLGLGAQFLFVFENGVDDEIVATGDDEDGQDVVEDGSRQDVALVVHGLRHVVVGASFYQIIVKKICI